MEGESVPKFALDGSFYDQSTYKGRVLGFLDVVDPRMLLVGESQVRAAQGKLADFKAGNAGGHSDRELWEAKKMVDAVVNPGSGDIIPAPVRICGFIPANVPLVYGMLTSSSVAATLFWQWANQSYNSATNYANRSGSSMSTEEIATSYGIAVGTSCGLAMTFRWLGQHGPPLFRRAAAIPFIIPYIAVGGAGAANVYFTRKPEIDNGVVVRDAAGKEVGVSKEAGRQGVMKTILSRSLGLPIPVLIIPSAVMAMLPKTLPKRTLLMAELLVITGALCVALPGTLALFPQRLELDVKTLEPEFQKLIDEKGVPITTLFSNKGL